MPEANKELPEEIEEIEEFEEAESGPNGLVRLLLMVLPVLLIPAAVGGFLAYSQYVSLAQTAVTNGFEFGLVEKVAGNEPIEYGQFATINDLLINPKNSGGKRFLVLSLGVETKSSDVIAELEQKEIVIRDAILQMLSEHTADELSSIELRETLKIQLIARLNSHLQKGEIDRLYFTQYLLQ